MLKSLTIAALAMGGALMVVSPASADCRCGDNHNRGRSNNSLISVDANVGGRTHRGGLVDVGANVGGRHGLVDADVNVLGNGRRNNGLLNVDANVGGRRNGLIDADVNVLGNSRRNGGLLNVDANVGGNGRRNGGLLNLNVGVLQGGVGGH